MYEWNNKRYMRENMTSKGDVSFVRMYHVIGPEYRV